MKVSFKVFYYLKTGATALESCWPWHWTALHCFFRLFICNFSVFLVHNVFVQQTQLALRFKLDSCVGVISHLKCDHKLDRESVIFNLGKLHAYHRCPSLASRSNIFRNRFSYKLLWKTDHVWDDHHSVRRVVGRFKISFNWAVGATPLLTGCIEEVSCQYLIFSLKHRFLVWRSNVNCELLSY